MLAHWVNDNPPTSRIVLQRSTVVENCNVETSRASSIPTQTMRLCKNQEHEIMQREGSNLQVHSQTGRRSGISRAQKSKNQKDKQKQRLFHVEGIKFDHSPTIQDIQLLGIRVNMALDPSCTL